MPMERVGRAVERSETKGFMKIIVDAEQQARSWAPRCSASVATRSSTALLDLMYAKAPYTVDPAGDAHPPDRHGADPDGMFEDLQPLT